MGYSSPFPAVALFLPLARGALREGGVHFGVIGFFAETLVDRLLQSEGGFDAVFLVGLDEDDFAAGPLEAEKQRALAGMGGDQFPRGFQILGRQMRHLQAQMDLLGIDARRVFQRDDFLRENLRLVLGEVDFAGDQQRLLGNEQVR